MVTVAEVLALTVLLKSPLWNTQLSEYAVIIPKSLHLGLLRFFLFPFGTAIGVLKVDWQREAASEGKPAGVQRLPFICCPLHVEPLRLIVLGTYVTEVI